MPSSVRGKLRIGGAPIQRALRAGVVDGIAPSRRVIHRSVEIPLALHYCGAPENPFSRSSNVTAAAPEPLSDTIRGKYDLDVVDHYAPTDVFDSQVDARKQTPVRVR